jgi:hypothetical protein
MSDGTDRLAEASGATQTQQKGLLNNSAQNMNQQVESLTTDIISNNKGNKSAALEQLDLLKQSISEEDLKNKVDATIFKLHESKMPSSDAAHFVKEAFSAALANTLNEQAAHTQYEGVDVHITSRLTAHDAIKPMDKSNKTELNN